MKRFALIILVCLLAFPDANAQAEWAPHRLPDEINVSYGRFDRIVFMDRSNLRLVQRIIPDDPEKKFRMLMSYAGKSRDALESRTFYFPSALAWNFSTSTTKRSCVPSPMRPRSS